MALNGGVHSAKAVGAVYLHGLPSNSMLGNPYPYTRMLMRYRGVGERTCSASFLEEFFSETQSGLLHQEEGPTHSPNVPPSPQEVLSLEPASATEPSAASSPRCAAISLA